VSISAARRRSLFANVLRAGARLGAAGLFLFGANNVLQTAVAEGDTRSISFHHLHTDENITITYKRNGRYDDAALKKLDWFMRDWRREESTEMDPHLFDLLWETNREVGGTEPIQVVCGFRSPETNAMLHARSSGVAQFSQHTQGHAMDFFMPGVALDKIRFVGLRLQRGGVGFYPTSGSPFVHLDTGSVRHWPRMTHDELAKVFPDGRTVHVPSDGVPLPGYALALADVERRGGVPSGTSLEAARDADVITASVEREAAKPKRSLLARLFGAPKDEDEQSEQPAPKSANLRARAPVVVASLSPPTRVTTETIVPMPTSRPKPVAVAGAMPKPKPAEAKFETASLASNVLNNRGYWRGAVESAALPPPSQTPFEVASAADPVATVSPARAALAYAAEAETPAQATQAAQVRPMGSSMPRLPAAATVMPAPTNSTTVVKPPLAAAKATSLANGGQRLDSPWLRATMLTPSVSGVMTAMRLGPADPRQLQELLLKPSQSLVMTFSADPHLGMVADRFTGSAVVFLTTATFTTQTSASLQ
jgi:uncharacterized protein YcbK (DUF882 family)